MMNGRLLREKDGNSEERKGRQGEKKGRIWSQLTSGGVWFEPGPNDTKARAFSFVTQPSNIIMSEKERQGVCDHNSYHQYCLCSAAQSCPTLCNPMDWSPAVSSVHGIFQARILEWGATSCSRESSLPRVRTPVSCASCIGRWVLYHWATWEASPPVLPEPTHVPGLCHLSALLCRWGTSFLSLSMGEDQWGVGSGPAALGGWRGSVCPELEQHHCSQDLPGEGGGSFHLWPRPQAIHVPVSQGSASQLLLKHFCQPSIPNRLLCHVGIATW